MDGAPLHEQVRVEGLIAGSRVILAVFALLVLQIDPDLSATSSGWLAPIAVLFVVYAVLFAAVSTRPAMARHGMRLVLQLSDFILFSALIYVTHASVSPFFTFFLFSLITALLRFGVPGMVLTAACACLVYVALALADENIRADPSYLVLRTTSLALTTLLLVRLGTHYTRVRTELTKLASWPHAVGSDAETVVRQLLPMARDLVGCRRVLLVWDEEEEPWTNLAVLGSEGIRLSRQTPDYGNGLVEEAVRDATFLVRTDAKETTTVAGGPGRRAGEAARAMTEEMHRAYPFTAALSAPVRGQSVTGRIFFLDGDQLHSDDLAVADVAARLVAATLDQLNSAARSRNAAVVEERIRVGRELHDGVLQSLTGVALQLELLHGSIERDPAAALPRVRDLQELIASDQSDLRMFISQLRPDRGKAEASLHRRLGELAQRFERQWDVKVSMTTEPGPLALPAALTAELYSTVNEAVANAAKHSGGRQIDVELKATENEVTVVVEDDGHGFPFHGNFTLQQLDTERRGPVTLKERVSSLRGDMFLQSSTRGTRLEIRIPRYSFAEVGRIRDEADPGGAG